MPSYLDRIASLFRPKPVTTTGLSLYAACVDQARRPVFYTDYGIEDAIGARFELLTFHVALVIDRLKAVAEGDRRRERAQETAQALFDAFLSALDNTLREQGTGDLSVPKTMKRLGTVIYTRMKRWEELWGEDATAQADYAARTLLAGRELGDETEGDDVAAGITPLAEAFAAYAEAARAKLDIDALLDGRADWATAPALNMDA